VFGKLRRARSGGAVVDLLEDDAVELSTELVRRQLGQHRVGLDVLGQLLAGHHLAVAGAEVQRVRAAGIRRRQLLTDDRVHDLGGGRRLRRAVTAEVGQRLAVGDARKREHRTVGGERRQRERGSVRHQDGKIVLDVPAAVHCRGRQGTVERRGGGRRADVVEGVRRQRARHSGALVTFCISTDATHSTTVSTTAKMYFSLDSTTLCLKLAATLWWFTAAPKPLKIQVFWGSPSPRGRTAPIF